MPLVTTHSSSYPASLALDESNPQADIAMLAGANSLARFNAINSLNGVNAVSGVNGVNSVSHTNKGLISLYVEGTKSPRKKSMSLVVNAVDAPQVYIIPK